MRSVRYTFVAEHNVFSGDFGTLFAYDEETKEEAKADEKKSE